MSKKSKRKPPCQVCEQSRAMLLAGRRGDDASAFIRAALIQERVAKERAVLHARKLAEAVRNLINTHTGAPWQTPAVQRQAWTEGADALLAWEKDT